MSESRGHRLTFRPVDRENWSDFERLFEGPGGPKHCWCTLWWQPSPERARAGNAGRKSAMAKRVRAGTPVGLLAYENDEPVAWCSVAPRATFRPMGGPPDQDGENVWSIVCFFVPRRRRGDGLSRKLIEAAERHARANGATVMEAYPVSPDAPSYRFMGFVPVFRDAGFAEVGRAGTRRHVMRKPLRRGRAR